RFGVKTNGVDMYCGQLALADSLAQSFDAAECTAGVPPARELRQLPRVRRAAAGGLARPGWGTWDRRGGGGMMRNTLERTRPGRPENGLPEQPGEYMIVRSDTDLGYPVLAGDELGP